MTAGRVTTDAIVVGAGIVGAAVAEALAKDGARVTIFDSGAAALGATAVGMGHLVAMDDSPAQLALTSYSLNLWKSLASELPPSAEYDPAGTLWVAEDEMQLEGIEEKVSAYEARGMPLQWLDGKRVVELEPNLRPGLAGGVLAPRDAILYPPGAALALLQRARAQGAQLREHTEVLSIGPNQVTTREGTISAGVIVNAAGTGAARLTPDLPIVPRKGHLVITDRAPGFCRHQIVEMGYLKSAHQMTAESAAFNVQPRATGQVLIGSSRELVGWDASVNHGLVAAMLSRAQRFMPSLSRLPAIRIWTGFRPATPDKLPLIGRWEKTPGLWIAAGHEGLGITASVGTAGLLADLIAGRNPGIDPAPFAPGRPVKH
ncbi:MAG TPA: FAD-dependent oxidoreductase [Gemmatimonadales bacterium]|nr:FAD-dependent oxidoreductase [Gemmatimonadales bacterium]